MDIVSQRDNKNQTMVVMQSSKESIDLSVNKNSMLFNIFDTPNVYHQFGTQVYQIIIYIHKREDF